MANAPNTTTTPEPEVKGKDLLQRGLDALFGTAGDLIHGATQKGKTKDGKQATQDDKTPDPTVVEAEGEEVPSQGSAA